MAVIDANALDLYHPASDPDPELLARMFLAGYKAATAEVYALGLRQWFAFCAANRVDPLQVRRTHFDLWRGEGLTVERIATKPKRPGPIVSRDR
jgi:hypothetical protein